jgi:hypothetical protein
MIFSLTQHWFEIICIVRLQWSHPIPSLAGVTMVSNACNLLQGFRYKGSMKVLYRCPMFLMEQRYVSKWGDIFWNICYVTLKLCKLSAASWLFPTVSPTFSIIRIYFFLFSITNLYLFITIYFSFFLYYAFLPIKSNV